MNLQLTNKVVIVTGGASGIGESIVRKLVDENAIPCIVDRDEERTMKFISELETLNKKSFFVIADLSKTNACKIAIDKILNATGRIDGLVNNAGLNDGVSLVHGTYESFISSLQKNVGHYYSITQAALTALKKSGGSIVNICSKVAETGQGETSGYAAANGLRYQLTSQWANELSMYNIRTNAIIVAECYTPQYEWWINKQSNPEEKLHAINSKIPLGKRMTTPAEIADTALFLLSQKSASINGEFFHADGGYVHLDRKA